MTIQNKLHLPLITLLLHQSVSAELFPNGDFEAGVTSWEEVSGGGTYSFSYPTTEGNPDGYGVIDHTAADGGFGIWVANSGAPLLLTDLGLTAGMTYNFTQDMLILSGPDVGGFKLDFTNSGESVGTTGDLRIPTIGDGTTWETYAFQIEIPAGADGFKVVPLWGIDSSVGFDNIGFDPTPVDTTPPPEPTVSCEPELVRGTLVSWVPVNPEKFHQPQSSQDGENWTDLGPSFLGCDTESILDPSSALFYRIQERDPAGEQALINGDFEIADPFNADCAESWSCLSTSGQNPTRIETDSFSGNASIRIAVQNDDSGAPNQSEMQQNLVAVGGSITGGETYTLSFQAKQISLGVSYVQNYRLQWFDGGGAPIPGADIGFNSFTGGDDNWLEISPGSVVAPSQAAGAFIQIFGATGAVPGEEARGEVLIDDIRLSVGGSTEGNILEATTTDGIGVSMLTKIGVTYKSQQSEDLDDFSDLSDTFIGNGQAVGAGIPVPDGGPSHYFRILEVTEAGN